MLDLAGGRLGMDAAVAALLEFEVLHRVGEVGLLAVDPGLPERPVEKLAGRTDEGAALQILLIARLFADEDDARMAGPSPNTAWVAPGTSGPALAMMALSSSKDFGSCVAMARARARACVWPAWSPPARSSANARGGGPDEVRDGRGLRQVAPVLLRHIARAWRSGFIRAGLNMLS